MGEGRVKSFEHARLFPCSFQKQKCFCKKDTIKHSIEDREKVLSESTQSPQDKPLDFHKHYIARYFFRRQQKSKQQNSLKGKSLLLYNEAVTSAVNLQ